MYLHNVIDIKNKYWSTTIDDIIRFSPLHPRKYLCINLNHSSITTRRYYYNTPLPRVFLGT